ncbi:HPP family protein [Flammeovirga agarivorans]
MKNYKTAIQSGTYSFIGISILALLNSYFDQQSVLLTGAFGATAVLLFAASDSPLVKRKNMYLGHLSSAFIGVSSYSLFYSISPQIAVALAVGVSIGVMVFFDIVHPPGGATAYIAVYGGQKIHALGYGYLFFPVLIGVIILDIIKTIQPNKKHYECKSENY